MNHEQLTERSSQLTPLFKQFQQTVKGLQDFGYTDETIRTLLGNTLSGRGQFLTLDPAHQGDMARFSIQQGVEDSGSTLQDASGKPIRKEESI